MSASRWAIFGAAAAASVASIAFLSTSLGRRLTSTWLGLYDKALPATARRVRSLYGVEEYNARAYALGIVRIFNAAICRGRDLLFRDLAPFIRLLCTQWPSRIGIVISIEGPLGFEIIRGAFLRLQRQNHLWNCGAWLLAQRSNVTQQLIALATAGIHSRRGTLYFHEFSDAQQRTQIQFRDWKGIDTLEDYWDEELNRNVPLSAESLLWSSTIFRETDSLFHVGVFQHHCIGDGASLLHMIGDLLRELGKETQGLPLPPVAVQTRETSFYGQISQLKAWKSIPLWRRVCPRIFSAFWGMRYFSGTSHLPIHRPMVSRNRRTSTVNVSLPATDLEQFRSACKRRNITVTSAVTACFVEAAKSILGLPEDEEVLSVHIPMSIRERIEPPVSRGEYVEAISVARVDIPLLEDVWECASYISTNLLNAEALQRHIAEGEFAIEAFNAAFRIEGEKIAAVANSNPSQCAPAVVSCLGVFQDPLYPLAIGPFKAVDLNIGQTLGAFGAHPALACYTYCGVFRLNLSFSEPLLLESQAVSLLEVMLRIMNSMAETET